MRDKITPYQARHGDTPDISAYLLFEFWESILYLDTTAKWPAPLELAGRYLGISHNVGDSLTFLVLDETSKQVISRSVIRSATSNKRANWDYSLGIPRIKGENLATPDTPADPLDIPNDPEQPPPDPAPDPQL